MISHPLRKSLRRMFKRGRAPAPARSPKLHRAITERGNAENELRDNVANGHLGIHWSGTSFCDGIHRCDIAFVLPAPSLRDLDAWIERTDPGIEGPCSYFLFTPSNEQIARGY